MRHEWSLHKALDGVKQNTYSSAHVVHFECLCAALSAGLVLPAVVAGWPVDPVGGQQAQLVSHLFPLCGQQILSSALLPRSSPRRTRRQGT